VKKRGSGAVGCLRGSEGGPLLCRGCSSRRLLFLLLCVVSGLAPLLPLRGLSLSRRPFPSPKHIVLCAHQGGVGARFPLTRTLFPARAHTPKPVSNERRQRACPPPPSQTPFESGLIAVSSLCSLAYRLCKSRYLHQPRAPLPPPLEALAAAACPLPPPSTSLPPRPPPSRARALRLPVLTHSHNTNGLHTPILYLCALPARPSLPPNHR
jgi:hypothetical protein